MRGQYFAHTPGFAAMPLPCKSLGACVGVCARHTLCRAALTRASWRLEDPGPFIVLLSFRRPGRTPLRPLAPILPSVVLVQSLPCTGGDTRAALRLGHSLNAPPPSPHYSQALQPLCLGPSLGHVTSDFSALNRLFHPHTISS